MQLTLSIRVPDSPSSVWRRQVHRPYVNVPRAGDWVYLAESDEGQGMFATPVTIVTWNNDGSINLRFDLENAAQAAQMEAFGFERDP
jgi:hypothetical protein